MSYYTILLHTISSRLTMFTDVIGIISIREQFATQIAHQPRPQPQTFSELVFLI